MPPTSSVRQLLAGRTLHIAALAVVGLLAAPLGACGDTVSAGNGGGGAGGGGAGGYGAGGAQRCPSTNEDAVINVTRSNGEFYDCSTATSPEFTLSGVVRNVAADTIVVDSCLNANCAPMENVITLSGTDLSVSIPDGTVVQVGLYTQPPQVGCMLHVIVRSGTFLWLAYHYGFDRPYGVPDDPYQTERELVCKGESEFFPDVYTWHFTFPDGGAEVVAPRGQTVTWSVPAGEHAGEYRVRNVKAEFWNHGRDTYWIARK